MLFLLLFSVLPLSKELSWLFLISLSILFLSLSLDSVELGPFTARSIYSIMFCSLRAAEILSTASWLAFLALFIISSLVSDKSAPPALVASKPAPATPHIMLMASFASCSFFIAPLFITWINNASLSKLSGRFFTFST